MQNPWAPDPFPEFFFAVRQPSDQNCALISKVAFAICFALMVSSLDRAKRALVALLKALATAYNVALTLTRESCDADVSRAYRQISRKVQEPRRGGEETTPSVRSRVSAKALSLR